jgi:hypothetical protein
LLFFSPACPNYIAFGVELLYVVCLRVSEYG